MVLDSMFKQTGLDQKQFPIHWWKIRDLRTAIDLTAFPEKLNGYTNAMQQAFSDGLNYDKSTPEINARVRKFFDDVANATIRFKPDCDHRIYCPQSRLLAI